MKPELWQRQQALMLASQLPDNTADALAVLEAAREIVRSFLEGSEKTGAGENVLHAQQAEGIAL